MNIQEMRLVIKHAPGSLPLRVVNDKGQVCRVIGMSYDPLRPDDGFTFDIDAREEVLAGNVWDQETADWANTVSNRADTGFAAQKKVGRLWGDPPKEKAGMNEADPDCPACGRDTVTPPLRPWEKPAMAPPTCSESFDDGDLELADKLVDLVYDLFHALKAQLKTKLPTDPGLRERFLVGGKITLLIPDHINVVK